MGVYAAVVVERYEILGAQFDMRYLKKSKEGDEELNERAELYVHEVSSVANFGLYDRTSSEASGSCVHSRGDTFEKSLAGAVHFGRRRRRRRRG